MVNGMKFFKKIGVKWTVILLLIAVLAGCTLFDLAYAQSYELTYTYTAKEGNLSADSKNTVTIEVTLTRNGKPVAGHLLWMDSPTMILDGEKVSGGDLKVNQIATDEEGRAEYIYYPYTANPKFKPAGVVDFRVRDLDSSVIVEIYVQKKFSLDLRAGEE